MPERDQAGRAEQQVEAHREQRIDRDLLGEEHVVARAEPRHRASAEEDDQRPWDAPDQPSAARPHPGAAVSLAVSGCHSGRPNRPHGRTIRITAISANTENSEKPGKIRMPKRQHLAVDHRTPERAPERAHAADHDDDEGLDDDQYVHPRHDALDRRHQRAGEPGEERAEHEHAGVDRADIGAERVEHLAVHLGGAHHPPDAGAVQHQPAAEARSPGRSR